MRLLACVCEPFSGMWWNDVFLCFSFLFLLAPRKPNSQPPLSWKKQKDLWRNSWSDCRSSLASSTSTSPSTYWTSSTRCWHNTKQPSCSSRSQTARWVQSYSKVLDRVLFWSYFLRYRWAARCSPSRPEVTHNNISLWKECLKRKTYSLWETRTVTGLYYLEIRLVMRRWW